MSEPEKTEKTEAKASPSAPPPEETAKVTQGSLQIAGETVPYEVTAGNYLLKKENGEIRASVFYVAYRRTGDVAPDRPITFAFNGGPGSSSVWLHLGVLGPKRVALDDDEGLEITPPYRLVDNDLSILDETDLVFIDPISTGYSRAIEEEKAGKEFHGVKQDVEAVADFIRLFLTRSGRWTSPKFLAGESYGTTRAAALAGHLMERHSIYVNGLMLISSILNFQTVSFDPGNDLPYILHLPTYAAIAHYHGRLKGKRQGDLKALLKEAEAFAFGPYASALLKGDHLEEAERGRIARRLSELTGLSRGWLERANLRIEILRFTRELLREDRRSVGRLDGRFKGIEADANGEMMTFHPSLAVITGAYAACLNHFVRQELGYESDLPYEILTGRVHPWDFSEHANKYLDVAETLRTALSHNPHMRVYVGSGYYDLGTPYFATDYTFSHLGLEPELRDRVSLHYYESGHMMYIHRPSLVAMREHMLAVMRGALGRA